jgi:hypothetical protein
METVRARCRKCGVVIDSNRNVLFPRSGGVEHLTCAKVRTPQARVSGDSTGWRCVVCDQPMLRGDQVVLLGHDMVHAQCRDRLRAIGGGSGPSARRFARALIDDPFARTELVATAAAVRLEAADVCAMSRYMRSQRSRGRRGNPTAA